MRTHSQENHPFTNMVQVIATYDGTDLTHLTFADAKCIDRQLLRIISLIVEFYPHLVGITIKCGIDLYTNYELCNILANSKITEIYLDDTFVQEGNYALLLKEVNNLQVLSLARCRIGDHIARDIASTLHYPKPASLKLSALNLSSNRLTSKTAKSFAIALRTNRKLCYLNLASNSIDDEGMVELLKVCLPFKLTAEENLDFRREYTSYSKHKQAEFKNMLNELSVRKFLSNLKSKKSSFIPKSDNPKDDAILYKQAVVLTEQAIGKFEYPFLDGEIIDGHQFCNGNYSLAYLNVAYNNLSYISLEVLERVVIYQEAPARKAKGKIINVRLDGNPMPVECAELKKIDLTLEVTLAAAYEAVFGKKKSTKK